MSNEELTPTGPAADRNLKAGADEWYAVAALNNIYDMSLRAARARSAVAQVDQLLGNISGRITAATATGVALFAPLLTAGLYGLGAGYPVLGLVASLGATAALCLHGFVIRQLERSRAYHQSLRATLQEVADVADAEQRERDKLKGT